MSPRLAALLLAAVTPCSAAVQTAPTGNVTASAAGDTNTTDTNTNRVAASVVGSVPIPPGFARALFADDFSGLAFGSPPSPDRWVVDLGTSYPGGAARWGTDEVQTYTADAANLAISFVGTLLITPRQLGGGEAWTSARIETAAAHDFRCDAGQRLRMEARLRLGDGSVVDTDQLLGIWPAFWSLGSAFRGNYRNWPVVGEIDILESANGQPTVWHTVHCGTVAGGPCHETAGLGSTAPLSRGVWHTVAVEIDRTFGEDNWPAETLTWLVNGAPTLQLSGQAVGDAAAWAALAHAPKLLLLNVAVGGRFPDDVAQTATPTDRTRDGPPAALEVQHVGVFST